jgi:DNA modification methylase
MSSSPERTVTQGKGLPPARDLSGEFRKYIGKQVSYATHGIHRYPAKFIPQIPRYCIESHSRIGDVVLDPFMGSGTTLLESYIAGRTSYGIDIHPLARLIAKVKTTPLDPHRLDVAAKRLIECIKRDESPNKDWIPEIPNREHWFKESVLTQLATIKKHVWSMPTSDMQDFFKICLSSIVRKVSNSDDDSLIPEVTSFQKKLDMQGKTSYDAIARFENTVNSKLVDASDLWRISGEVSEGYRETPTVNIIGNDARDIDLEDASIDLAVTSPPYASAVHYVSVHKLEMFWLGLLNDTSELDARIVGTARAYVSDYRAWEPRSEIASLHKVLDELVAKDKKSAYIVYKYFDEMRKNFEEVNRVLKRNRKYCVVVGENTFRKVRIPTYRILENVARRSGFELAELLCYDVINRHLDIPRWNDSRIERDYVLVLRRKSAPSANAL